MNWDLATEGNLVLMKETTQRQLAIAQDRINQLTKELTEIEKVMADRGIK